MGHVQPRELAALVAALEDILHRATHAFVPGAGAGAFAAAIK